MHFNNEDEEHYRLTLSRFESMLKTNKVLFFDSEEFENIILFYLDSGKLNLAKKALLLAKEQHPNSTSLKLVEVELLIFQNKFEAAIRLLALIQEIDSNNEEVYIQRASIYSKKAEHHKAIEQLEKALTLTEDLSDVHSLLGMEYLLIDEIEKAKHSFISCLEHDKDDQSALYNVIYCFEFLDQHQEAIDYLSHYIDNKPYSEIAWHQLGKQYFAIKNYKKSVWAFEYATLIDEQFLGAYLEKGKALEKLEQYQEAIESYQTTLDLDDPTSFVLLRMGNCYEQLLNFPKAMEHYKRAVHEDPLLDKGWIALTDLCIKEENFERALFYLQKALQIDEFSDKYWIRYALLNKYMLHFEQAEIGYKRAAELGNYMMEHWLGWADTLYILQNYDAAIEKLLQISDFNKENPDALYRLAVVYFTVGDYNTAKDYLISALQVDPKKVTIIEKSFVNIWENPLVQNIIRNFNAQ